MNTRWFSKFLAGLIASLVLLSMFIGPAHAATRVTDALPWGVQTSSTTYTAISAGIAHTCGLTSGGGVKCWGSNFYGELGDGTTIQQNIPVDVVGLSSGVTAISTFYDHNCVLTSSGGVKCWGHNYTGQLGDGTNIDRHSPVDVVGLSSGVIAISAGGVRTCALTSIGGVKCWGDNDYGLLGDGTTIDRYSPVDVLGLGSGVIAIDVGASHACALTSIGAAKCWGYNWYGQLGDGSNANQSSPVDVVGLSTGVIAISVGHTHTCAITSIGAVKCWGYNASGGLGDDSTIDRNTPVDVVGLSSDVISIDASVSAVYGYHTCALTSSRVVKCWGSNTYGALGDGTYTDRKTPVTVFGLANDITAIKVGYLHTCALTYNGGIKCWGFNDYGQLGDGTKTSSNIPVNVVGSGSIYISGRVVDGSSNGIAGVTISDGAGHSITSDSSGNYILSGLAADIYTLTPAKNGHYFTPPSRTVTVPPDGIDQDFTISHIPVIFIPGIMGSNLYDENGTHRWLELLNYRPIFLDSDGLSPDPLCLSLVIYGYDVCNQHTINGSDGMILTSPSIPPPFTDSVYKNLVDHFIKDQHYIEGNDDTVGDFWVFNYDWRKNIIFAADQLDVYVNTIMDKTQATQVTILAHSMGGLVARQYISDPNRALKVSQLITLGTPYLGTPQALAVLQGMTCVFVDLKIGCLPPSDTISAMAHNFPAFHELLPSKAYFDAKGSGYYANDPSDDPVDDCPHCLTYDQTYQLDVATDINPPLMTQADAFHHNLDNSSWNNVPLTVIYGIGMNTIAGIKLVKYFSWSFLRNITISMPDSTLNGDDTVTTLSATMSGLGVDATYLPFFDEHGGLVNDPFVLAHVDTALGLPQLAGSLLMPQRAASDPTAAEIVASGVKVIDVTDSAGNHTGPQVGSDLMDESIPGSIYFSQDDLAMVALLGGQNYTITLTPAGNGSVDISLVRMTTSGPSATRLYTGIPTSAQSRIRFSGDPYLENTWHLDVDGSGSQVQTLDPSVSYTGTQPVDNISPQASIQIQGTVGPNGWYTAPATITLSALDNAGGSGVNRIEYAFANDRTPRLYSGPFIADPNRVTILYVIATDQAGNQQLVPTIARIGPEKNLSSDHPEMSWICLTEMFL